MKENLVSLAKLLATDDTFNLAFSSQGTNEEKYELVKTKFADLTREDFSEFLEKLCEAEKNSLASCSSDELEMITGGMRGWVTKTAAMTVIATALGTNGVMSLNTDAMKPGSHARTSASKGTKRSPAAAANSTHNGQTPPTDAAATSSNPNRRASQPAAVAATTTKRQRRVSQPAAAAAGTPLQAQKQWRKKYIRLGEPRSSKVEKEFYHGDKSAQEVLQAHTDNNRVYGSSSLIGELAQIVQIYLAKRKIDPNNPNLPPLNLCGITFKFGRNDDIVAHQCGTYNKIIEKMILSTSPTPTSKPDASEAEKKLPALSSESTASEPAEKLPTLSSESTASEPAEKLPTSELDFSKAAEILANLKYPVEEKTAPESAWPRRELDSSKAAEILVKLAHSELEKKEKSPMPTSELDHTKVAEMLTKFKNSEEEEKTTPESTASEPVKELSTPPPESTSSKPFIRKKARKILENLSKPCEIPDEIKKDIKADNGRYEFDFDKLTLKHIETLAGELFEGLDDGSKDLVAVFLCECIRFNDDGALVRWSIRKVLLDCDDQKPGISPIKMQRSFDSKSPEAASFAKRGGKSTTNELINNAPEDLSQAGLNALRTLEGSKQCLSPTPTSLSDPIPQSTEEKAEDT